MPKRKCTFNEELQREFTFLKKGKIDSEVQCTHCGGVTFSVAHGGRSDINDHIKSARHIQNVQAKSSKGLSLNQFIFAIS